MICRVYNDSKIRHSKGINFDVACPMTFHKFPLDVQSCKIKFESYGYLSDELNMKWKKDDKCQVIVLKSNLQLE